MGIMTVRKLVSFRLDATLFEILSAMPRQTTVT